MSQQLINHSADLQKLLDHGLVMDIRNNFLFIHRVPYLTSSKKIKYGTLVSRLQLAGLRTQPHPEHTAYFAGDTPCKLNGQPLNIINNTNKQVIADGFQVNIYFSSKPKPNGYTDYYHKMMTYINMLSAPAKAIDDKVTERGKKMDLTNEDSVFNYADTNSNKPELIELTKKFHGQKIGIIGVGGTGSYILDLVTKTPVAEIHLFDGDWYYNNNAFRSPGAASMDDLMIPEKKVVYFQSIYSRMHKNIITHGDYLTETELDKLQQLTFVFINIDKGEIKKKIVKFLQSQKIPFVDSGIGVEIKNGALTGLIRNTTSSDAKSDHLWDSRYISYTENPDNEYDKNIQIAELNLLNAGFAVMKWKKLLGFYHDLTDEHNMFYRINANRILNDETRT
ncbi:ThiF family adenylyltransferase [Tunicatimonas pelagia]|uniref:ThiF family adenylyltransferase n=1 Tax=Tunicatimonas pelagia TaxID=931531 RepID=UPI0026660AB5|nr:ThiF family adenylyltransferase [Tunicatimonas pelagia]WKN46440.1 ThiF family adenylyltransferase [Tunicatimonas pelagia]